MNAPSPTAAAADLVPDPVPTPGPVPPAHPPRPAAAAQLLRRLVHRPSAAAATATLVLMIAACTLAPWLAPFPPLEQDLRNVYQGPTAQHWLGTDFLGRDLLTRLLHGGRVTLLGLATAVGVFLAIGVPVGLVAGFFGGWFERVVLRLTEILYSLPVVILILVVLAVFGNSETAAMVALGVLGAPSLIRILRGNIKVLRQELYVRAARAAGLTELQVLRLHVLPRLVGPIIVQTTLFGAGAILTETGLGFLGLGVQPPDPSWGNLVADASTNIDRHPWMLVPTGATIAVTILALGLLGDGLRDANAARSSRKPSPVRRPGMREPATDRPTPSSALLSVRELSVAFQIDGRDTEVVHEVTIDIQRGSCVGLVGESGCGKSVTATAMLGLLRPGGRITGGQVLFDGIDVAQADARTLRGIRGVRMAYISQEPVAGLDPSHSVGSWLVEVIRHATGLRRRAAVARAHELLAAVQINDARSVMRRYPHQLSGGMAQRIGIAAALAGDPELLVADEPTTALDVTTQAEILDLLRTLRADRDLALVLVTHDFGVVADLCDRAVVMYAGQVVEDAPVEALFRNPQHPYSAGLLRSNPAAVGTGERLPALEGSVPPPGSRPLGCHFQDRCPSVHDRCRAQPVAMTPVDRSHATRCVLAEEAHELGGIP